MNLDPIKTQLTEADLASMRPDQIEAAREAGQLDDLMGRSRYPSHGQLNAQHVGQMNTEEIREAYKQGRLTNLLGTTD